MVKCLCGCDRSCEAYANHTLLVVKGDYTYLPNGLADNETNYVKKENCYYAIPVGAEVTIEGKTESKKVSTFSVTTNTRSP